MSNANVREPEGTTGPTRIEVRLQKNEGGSVTRTFWSWTEDDGWTKVSLTAKTIEFRAKIAGTWVIWDNSTNGGLTLADQSTNPGECDVAYTAIKGTATAGVWECEGWDRTSAAARHKHLVGLWIIEDSGGPVLA